MNDDYVLQINDAARLTLRLLLTLIQQALVNSETQTLGMEIIVSIHGNGFTPFINFLNQTSNVILPGKANAIRLTIEEWYQDNSYPFGVFNILNMACIIGNKRTICVLGLGQYEFITIDNNNFFSSDISS